MFEFHLSLLQRLPEWFMLWAYPIITLTTLWLLAGLFRIIIPTTTVYDSDTDVVDTATQNSLSAAYVIMGFTLVLVMGSVDTYDNNVTNEAIQIESLDRLLLLDASPPAIAMRENLKAYAESIIKDEWPNIGTGSNKQTSMLMHKLSQSLQSLTTDTSRQQLLYKDIVRKTDQIIHSREVRLINISGSLPQLFWTISYLYLLCVSIICALRLSHSTPMRLIAISTQLTMLSLIFSAVMIIDHPFIGASKISVAPISKSLEIMSTR